MFVNKLKNVLENINIENISSIKTLERTVQEYMRILNLTWYKFSKNINITKCSKVWWNNKCGAKLNTYCSSKLLENWKEFKKVVKKTKYIFFNDKI